jgi:2-dehydrotetronate isomerase
MPRFAANLSFMFTDRPMIERFGAAAAAGFRAVEFGSSYDQDPAAIRAEIDRHGLTMLGVNTPQLPDASWGLAGVAGREADFDARFARALDLTLAIGGRAIHCMSGVVPASQHAAALPLLVANLQRVADRVAAHGLTILIEPINHRDCPDYLLSRVEQAADIIASVQRPNVRMQFDFYHAQIMGGDLIRRFEHHLPLIGHLQIAGVPTRAEPDVGEINYPAVFDAIDASGYAGWIGCEYRPRGKTEDGLAWGANFGLGKAKA